MEFTINRDIFLKALGHANGIIEKKTTLPILSNILIEAKDSKIKITATDLDIIYFEEILPKELKKEGSTTTSGSILYDILRKLKPNAKIELSLQNSNKIKLVSENSIFNLYLWIILIFYYITTSNKIMHTKRKSHCKFDNFYWRKGKKIYRKN